MTTQTAVKPLPMPAIYNPANAENSDYYPNDWEVMQAGEKWKNVHNLTPAGADSTVISVLWIDNQIDFCFPDGALYVAGRSGKGAMEAQKNMVEFLYRYLHIISQIRCTMDSHHPFQIFFPLFHLKSDDRTHPAPGTVITADEYRSGVYIPNPAVAKELNVPPQALQKYCIHYCERLEATGKYALMIWNPHCILGSKGHALAGVANEVRLFHSAARGAMNLPELKGTSPFTEHYSIFAPEVTQFHTGDQIPGVQKNRNLIETLLSSDVVIIGGEASSHCVKTSIEDFLGEIQTQDPELAKKVYILRDCMAPVVIPNAVDFTDDAEAALQGFESAGMNVVDSTTPIEDWPNIVLS